MTAARYDAFISYSHALDGTLAPTLQREIERFAKPWYRPRALRVFRDNTSLSAEPGLWTAIEEALASSEWLVLLASPVAAGSTWVDREVAWWLANRSPERLLIVVTDGAFVWDEAAGDVDAEASTAVPPALVGALAEEPRWVDLRWLREVSQVDRSNPRLRDCVADLVAAIRDQPKDLLIGEHIRQHRRTKRLAWSAVTVLSLLLVVSFVATMVAVSQRDEAVRQARLATARQLAATAVANLDTQVDLAQLLAAEAYRMERTPQTRSALFRSVTASPHLVRNLPVGDSVSALSATGNGFAVAGTRDGRVVRWDLSGHTSTETNLGDAAVVGVASAEHGDRVIATNGERTVLWDPSGSTAFAKVDVPDAKKVAISPSGRVAAVVSYVEAPQGPSPGATVTLVDGETGRQLNHVAVTGGLEPALPDDDTVVPTSGGGTWQRLSAQTLLPFARSDYGITPASVFLPGFSASGGYFGYVAYGNIVVVGTDSVPDLDYTDGTDTTVPVPGPEHMAVSDGGTYAAVAGGGALYVARVRKGTGDPPQDAIALTGRGRTEAVAFVGDGPELVSAAGNTLSLWNIAQPSPLRSGASVAMPSSPNAGGVPMLSVGPDGAHLAVTSQWGRDGGLVRPASPAVYDLTGFPPKTTPLGEGFDNALPLWSPDGRRLVLVRDGGAADVLVDGAVTATWPARGTARIVAGRLSPDGSRAVLVDQFGGVQIRDGADGTVRDTVRGVARENSTDGAYYGDAAISADGATAAVVLDRYPDADEAFVIDVEAGRTRRLPGTPASVAFGDGNLFVQRENGALEEWDAHGTTRNRTLTEDSGFAPAFAVVPHTGLLARLRGNGSVAVSDLDSGDVLGSVQLPPMTRSTVSDPWAVTALSATDQTGELVTATSGGEFVRWRFTEDAWLATACAVAGRDLTPDEWRHHVGTEPPADLGCSRP